MQGTEAGDARDGGWGCKGRRMGMQGTEDGDARDGGWGCKGRGMGMQGTRDGDARDGGWGCKGRGSDGVRAKKKVPPVQSTKGTSRMMGSMDV